MGLVSNPTFTDTVNQQFFIEALRGPQQPISYLDSFPDAVYTKAIDSVLVTFLYALLGPTGVGQIHKEYLEARLAVEDAGLSTVSLDALYTNPFAFARLAEETYNVDADSIALTADQRAQILAQDASFRNRAQTFFKGIRAGGTPLGISLAAKSGLNHPVDIIENYKFLYDQYGDDKLNLKQFGSTNSLSEIIVLPRQDIPRTSRQTVALSGNPVSGYFTLTYPGGSDYRMTVITTINGSSTVSVSNSALTPIGSWISITSAAGAGAISASPNPTTFAQVASVIDSRTITVVIPPGITGAGNPLLMTSNGSFWAYVGNGRTIRIPYNATSDLIQQALWSLPVIGVGNVLVSGGPLPNHPVDIVFTGNLADSPVPSIRVNSGTDLISGIGGPGVAAPRLPVMVDISGSSINVTAQVIIDQISDVGDTRPTTIAPVNQHAMEVAIDQIRPVTSFVTVQPAQSITVRHPIGNTFSSGSLTQILRYVTGSKFIVWPTRDGTHWIEAGVEHEAPHPIHIDTHHYQAFHDISNVIAYTEGALNDAYYSNPSGGPNQPIEIRYYDTMVGRYSDTQIALTPILGHYRNDTTQYSASYVKAVTPEPLIITDTILNTGLINDKYPVDYLSLPGIPRRPTQSLFYASAERTGGVDYLEIDLGNIEAVNYIYFEATRKPYLIDVAYDVADMTPIRKFIPAPFVPASIAPSVTSLSYTSAHTNPWEPVTLNVTNSLRSMIYTRHIRLGFTRNPAHSPYVTEDNKVIPYGIEIRNLRIGRNISYSGVGSQANPVNYAVTGRGIDDRAVVGSASITFNNNVPQLIVPPSLY